jgi:hypothetical protein
VVTHKESGIGPPPQLRPSEISALQKAGCTTKASLRGQRNLYNRLKKTYEQHLQKYGQTAGRTAGETNRMEEELRAMKETLRGRGQAEDNTE